MLEYIDRFEATRDRRRAEADEFNKDMPMYVSGDDIEKASARFSGSADEAWDGQFVSSRGAEDTGEPKEELESEDLPESSSERDEEEWWDYDYQNEPSGLAWYPAKSEEDFYHWRMFVLRQLAQQRTHTAIDALVAFIQHGHNSHVFTVELAEIFNDTDPQYASEQISTLARQTREEGKGLHTRYFFDLKHMLYRLDLGAVPLDGNTRVGLRQ